MEIRDRKCIALVQEMSAGWHFRHLILGIVCCGTAAVTKYPWPSG